MPVKSGTSHALSTFCLMIVSGILVTQYHNIYDYGVEKIAIMQFVCNKAKLIQEILFNAGYYIDTGVIESVAVATVLSFVWGILYHISRND